MRPSRRVLGGIVAALVLGVGCSGTESAQVPPAAPGARTGGTLRVAVPEPSSVDPNDASDAAGRLITSTMCDPLIAVDPVTAELRPAVLDSWQQWDRGKKMTLRVRRGARFSDGRDITANDVLFTLSRLASSELASGEADLVSSITGFDTVHGDKETDSEDLRRSLRGIKVIEGNSLEVELVTENAAFLRALTHPATSVVSREAVERDPVAFERSPVCSGPYRLAAPWRPGTPVIELERVPGYRPGNAAFTAGGRGYVDRIELVVTPDRQAQLAAFDAGRVDIAEVPDERRADVAVRTDARVTVVSTPTIEYVGLPTNDEVFRRPEVRRALSAALDRRAIAETVLGGARAAATGFYPPTLGPGLHRERGCAAVGAGPDLDLARSLLREVAVDLTGRRLELRFNDEQGNRTLLEEVAAQWKAALGLDVQLTAVPWQEYLTAATSGEGTTTAFRMSWASTYPDPDRYVAPLFTADGLGAGNFGRFANAELDRQLRMSARRALEADARMLEYRRLEDLVCELMPMVPVTFDLDRIVTNPRVAAPDGRLVSLPGAAVNLREVHLTS